MAYSQYPQNPKLTFGKFKGKHINELPSFYLNWLGKKAHSYPIKCAAREEYAHRTAFGKHWGNKPARRMS